MSSTIQKALFVIVSLVFLQYFSQLNNNFCCYNISSKDFNNDASQVHQRKDSSPPIWSAAKRLQLHDTSILDTQIRWRFPGKRKKLRIHRSATELVAYGMAGVLPYYGNILPALRFRPPFTNKTQVEIALVPDIIDIIIDLHECSENGNGTSTQGDGKFNACYSPLQSNGTMEMYQNEHGYFVGGAEASFHHCYMDTQRNLSRVKQRDRSYPNRKHNFPTPGHQKWSCSDHDLIEQLVAARVLDIVIQHRDRFDRDRNNNLFILSGRQPITFVSIDHDGNPAYFFKRLDHNVIGPRILTAYELPQKLHDDIRSVFLGSKDDFVKKFNATIDGQLDNLTHLLKQLWRKTQLNASKSPDYSSVTDALWYRLKMVAEYYNVDIT
mmetsp:Transcript_25299/g.28867  ORF Transcript_25299/g.28867 Transcript_25299/m.28867 type:complete len:381 (+) Transcript_25299:856-1998(+)